MTYEAPECLIDIFIVKTEAKIAQLRLIVELVLRGVSSITVNRIEVYLLLCKRPSIYILNGFIERL